jgi:hypothetical protein
VIARLHEVAGDERFDGRSPSGVRIMVPRAKQGTAVTTTKAVSLIPAASSTV